MGKRYAIADVSTTTLLYGVVTGCHPHLIQANVKIWLLMVTTDDVDDQGNPKGPVLMHHGTPAIAKASIVPIRYRAHGMPDGDIQIDAHAWETFTDEQQRAVLDHELSHFEVVHKENEVALDALGRPKLRMRPHDHTFGWFDEVVKRHGQDAIESIQARRFYESASGQLYLSL